MAIFFATFCRQANLRTSWKATTPCKADMDNSAKDMRMKTTDCSVLIIDDVTSVREYLRQTLMLLGITHVSEASDGSHGISSYNKLRHDVVFLDIELPDCDGKNLLRQLKEINPNANVVIMTAHSTVENVQQSILAGACGFIAKPFSAKKIESVLAKCHKTQSLR